MKKPEYDNLKITAVILAGNSDFGRYELARLLPRVLWPLGGEAVLARLIRQLRQGGIEQIVLCAGEDTQALRQAVENWNIENIAFCEEELPIGTAGCIRQAAEILPADEYMVVHGTIIDLPPVSWLASSHRRADCDMTAFINPPAPEGTLEFAGIYMCSHSVLGHISPCGYVDIKEGLIPALWRAGRNVKTVQVRQRCGGFRSLDDYKRIAEEFAQKTCAQHGAAVIDPAARVHRNARLLGPVVVMAGAQIETDALVVGPSIIEPGAVIESGALVHGSVIWERAVVGSQAIVKESVIGHGARIAADAVVENTALAGREDRPASAVDELLDEAADSWQAVRFRLTPVWQNTCRRLGLASNASGTARSAALWLAGIAIAFVWLYWQDLNELWDVWTKSDEYSSGMLVPLLAAYVVWARRERLFAMLPKPSGYGLILFAVAQIVRFFGLLLMYSSAQRISLLMSIAGIVLFIFGTRFFRSIAPVLVFLVLMLPMPKSVHTNIMAPLQDWATGSAVFSLETLGYEVAREGNIIHIGDSSVAVAEACNGLRMITAFFVISALVVLVIERPWWEKFVVLLSALPIGLFCNTVRLTGTAIAFTRITGDTWEKIFHDFGGFAMMPLALAIVVAELWLFKRLTMETRIQAGLSPAKMGCQL